MLLSMILAMAALSFQEGDDKTPIIVEKTEAQQKAEELQNQAKIVGTVIDACNLAYADVLSIENPLDRVFMRYEWIESRDIGLGCNFAWNAAASKSANGIKPVALYNAKVTVLRWDLRQLAPTDKSLKRLAAAWERLIFTEPYFNVTVTVPKFKDSNGVWNTQVIRAAPYLGESGRGLVQQTGSFVPIVRGAWSQVSMLTTESEDQEKTLLTDRGRYYDFADVAENLDDYLLSRGLSLKLIQNINSDARAAVVKSGITGTVRSVAAMQGSIPLTTASGVAFITFDPGRNNKNPLADPMRTLLGIDPNDEKTYIASELILDERNGMHGWSLWNNKKKRQNAVPAKVATDDDQPAGHPKELYAGIGCIRCHGKHDGWQPLRNNVRDLMRAGKVDYFGQQTLRDKRLSLHDTIGLIRDKYSGDLNPPLQLARDSYATAVFNITGKSVKEMSRIIGENYKSYMLDMVTPTMAAREMGFEVTTEEAAVSLLDRLWPTPAIGEDSDAANLKSNIPINRWQWERFFPDAMTRAQATLGN